MSGPRPVTGAAAAVATTTGTIATAAAASANTINAAAVERALAENTALIASILSHHNRGRHACAAALLARLQRNLAYVASVADTALPPRHRPRGTRWPPVPSQRSHPGLHQPAPQQNLEPTEQLPHQDRRLIQPVRFWTERERELFEQALTIHGGNAQGGKPDLKAIARHIGTRTPVQVRSYHQKWLKRQAKSKRAAVPSQGASAVLSPSTDGVQSEGKDAIHTRTPAVEGEAAREHSAENESRSRGSAAADDVANRSLVDARATSSGAELLHGLKARAIRPARTSDVEVGEETNSATAAVDIIATAASTEASNST
jgi:hypothetical protein